MMKSFQIVSGEIFVVRLPFRFRFQHATADRWENTTIFLKIKSSAGVTGWGETLTRPYLTGETEASVLASVQSWWAALKQIKFSADDPTALLRPMWHQADAAGAQAAWTLPDIAVRDLWMRSSASASSAVSSKSYEVTFPVGLGSSPWLLPVARMLKFRNIKFKTDRNTDATFAAVQKFGRSWDSIAIDANGCFLADDASLVRELVTRSGAKYMEEPFARENYASAAALIQDAGIRVVADESLRSMADARQLIKERAASVFNIRLAKLGGITGALAIGALAREHGIGIQVGALVGETGLLCNAARMCLGRLAPELVEYSFPSILLKKNPVESDVPIFSAVLREIPYRKQGLANVGQGSLGSGCISRLELS